MSSEGHSYTITPQVHLNGFYAAKAFKFNAMKTSVRQNGVRQIATCSMFPTDLDIYKNENRSAVGFFFLSNEAIPPCPIINRL